MVVPWEGLDALVLVTGGGCREGPKGDWELLGLDWGELWCAPRHGGVCVPPWCASPCADGVCAPRRADPLPWAPCRDAAAAVAPPSWGSPGDALVTQVGAELPLPIRNSLFCPRRGQSLSVLAGLGHGCSRRAVHGSTKDPAVGRARARAEQLPGVTVRVSCSGPPSSACAMGVPAGQGALEPPEPMSTNEPSQQLLQPSSGGSSHGCGSAGTVRFGQWGLGVWGWLCSRGEH